MNCAGFEHRLAELLGAESSEADRAALVADLGAHARSCPRCGSSADLLDLLVLPAGERDLAEEPPEEYWSELQAAVVRRVGVADRKGRRGRGLVWVAAAVILMAVAGLWLVRGPLTGGDDDPDGAGRSVEADLLPSDLDLLLQEAEPETALAGLDFLAGLPGVPGPGGDDGIVPLIEEIDAEDRDALLDWLNEREPVNREVES